MAGVAAVAAHILLAPATGVLTAGAVLAGWLTRWRPLWLTGPAAAGAVWTAAIGPWRAAAGLIAGPRLLLAYLAAVPGHPAHLQAAGTVLAQAAHLLPGQLPAGLLAASAEAAGLAWLAGRRRARGERHGAGGHGAGRPAGWRPGLIAIVRRYRTRAVLAAGHTATRTGFCLGLDPATGRAAELSWAAAGGGVLVSCAGPDAAARLSFPAAGAALARRMTLIVIDLTASDWLAADLAAACATAAVPLTRLRPAPPGHWVAAHTGSAPLASPATTSAAAISAATASAAAGSPQPAGADLSSAISKAVRNREVVVAALEPAIPARAAAAVAEQAASSLTAALRGLRTQELRGECLAWVHGCEVARPLTLARLLELGPGTGTAILLSTASDAAAALLADRVAAVVAGGPVGERLAVRLAVRPVTDLADGMSPASGEPVPRLRRQLADEFTIADARDGLRPGLRPACRQVAPARAQRARMAAEQITRGQPARGQPARGQPAPGQPAPGQPAPGRAPRAGNR